ncbi:hypothetical protein NQ318_007081 [Aromia moschata]|uniref:Uncharacterized protein n=1 Tax=Aromia moschata TaxID=1265417 RepID=A0AAV8XCG9_9CUCU|nr:hypothetical protein NQ318_007081 [Aromia moschata]
MLTKRKREGEYVTLFKELQTALHNESRKFSATPFSITLVAVAVECSSLYRAMQQQAFYFISRKYVHDVQQK